jgi:hypothetical protein
MNKWDTLPNAKHIDFVIGSLKQYPDEWASAYNVAWCAGGVESLRAARGTARDAVYDAARVAAWDAARDAVYDAARVAAWDAAYGAARDAILALKAYDDCEQYLDMSYNELLFMAKLTELPATILLLPYAKAMELIKEKE